MTSEIRINSELLIKLVKESPILWDRTHNKYKDKKWTLESWTQVFRKIYDGYDSLESIEKADFGKLIMKRWSNLRDNFMKCHKKIALEELHSEGAGKSKKRKYLFYDELSFLEKMANYRDSTVSAANAINTESETNFNPGTSSTIESEPLGQINMLKVVPETESRIMCFFKSIAPTVDKMDDEDVVTFQYEVMKLLKKITSKNQKVVYDRQQSLEEQYNFKLEHSSSSEPTSPVSNL